MVVNMAAAGEHIVNGATFVGGHPFAGAARSGIEYGSPDLFNDRPWFLTPPAAGAS